MHESHQYRETIEKILCITVDMLRFSKAGQWEEVADVENERQRLLDQLANIQIQEFDEISENILQKVIVINTEIEVLSRQEMKSCQQKFDNIKNKKKAINAYSTH